MKLIVVVCCVSDMQKESVDEDNVIVEVGGTPALSHISTEIKLSWDSCASSPFLTYYLVSQLY